MSATTNINGSDTLSGAFTFHDALVCTISEDEMSVIDDIRNHMETASTNLAFNFPVETKIGDNFAFED